MIFYDENKKPVEYNLDSMPLLGKGMFGKVYKASDETCLKCFNYEQKQNERPLKIIRDLSLPSFYDIYSFYYTGEEGLIGYLMKFYPKEDIDILGIHKDYLLKNFEQMYEDFGLISQNSMDIVDLNYNNIIFTEEKMIIIDADLYRLSNSSNAFTKKMNKKHLLFLYINLIIRQLTIKYGYDERKLSLIKDELVNFFYDKVKNPRAFERKLKEFERPIEFIRHLERKRK